MVSVVMAVHDTGLYLKNALECLIKQKNCGFEVICVDDYSTDQCTLDILDSFSNDERVNVVRLNKNYGAACARNIGLEQARGSYVIFLDSDDLFSENLISEMYNASIKDDLDICICSISRLNGKEIEYSERPSNVPNGCFSMNDLDERGFFYCWLGAWNKLIRRELLLENSIRFQSLSSSNDVYFTCSALQCATRIKYIDTKGLVIWRTNRNGQISSRRDPVNLLKAVDLFLKNTSKDDDKSKRKILEVLLRNGWGEIESSNDPGRNAEFCKQIDRFFLDNNNLLSVMTPAERMMLECYRRFTLDSKWWQGPSLFFYQMVINSDRIVDILTDKKRIVLWGTGRRGAEFLHFCKNKGIPLYGIVDKDPKKLSAFRDYRILNEDDESVYSADLIVASNSMVYEQLLEKLGSHICIVNLQEYCPAE